MRHTDVCPPCLESDTLTNFLTRSHISTVLRQFPSSCSVRTSRCASRGCLQLLGLGPKRTIYQRQIQSQSTVEYIPLRNPWATVSKNLYSAIWSGIISVHNWD